MRRTWRAWQLTPGEGTREDRQLRNFVQMLCGHQIDCHRFSPFYPKLDPAIGGWKLTVT